MQTPAQTAHQVSLRQLFKLLDQLIVHTSCATGHYVLRAVEYVINRREVLTCKILGQYRLTSVYSTSIRTQSITENRALLGSYAACSGNSLPTFLNNLSVPSSRVSLRLRMGPIGCPETSVSNYHYTLLKSPEERSSRLLRGGSLKSVNNCIDCLRCGLSWMLNVECGWLSVCGRYARKL